LRWDNVVYQPGTLMAVAYKKGEKWAEQTVKTTGAASKISVIADRATIKRDGKDLAFITVQIQDQEGLLVPNAKDKLQFSTSGPGEIVAIDNGDATDMTPFSANNRKAFNGLALVVVRANRNAGEEEIVITVSGAGLKSAFVTINPNK